VETIYFEKQYLHAFLLFQFPTHFGHVHIDAIQFVRNEGHLKDYSLVRLVEAPANHCYFVAVAVAVAVAVVAVAVESVVEVESVAD